MAPKATKALKRVSSATCASPKKRGRVDPMFAGITATLMEADDVSEQCRDMLVAFVVPSLSTLKNERHKLQDLGVKMIEETLQAHKTKLLAAVELAQKELTELEGSKSTLLQTLEDAKTALEEKKTTCLSVDSALHEAIAAKKAAEKAVAEAKDLREKGDANHAALEKERAAIDAAHQEHFKTPMDANEVPHYESLKPFIECLGLEDSLSSALPSSCAKGKEQRGSFDEIVITELGKALVAKIASLEKSVAEEAAGVSERSAAVANAEQALEAKNLAQKDALEKSKAAATAAHDAEAVTTKASEEWATFEPRVQEAADAYTMRNTMHMDFVEGALKDFIGLRDKEAPAPVEEEAAPGGA